MLLRTSLVSALIAAGVLPVAAITITQFNATYSENFDTLAKSGSSGVLPADWSLLESGSGADGAYAASTGSASTGNSYSFGASSAEDRALGAVRSSSLQSSWGVVIWNQTGGVISELAIQYFGEQWRLGALGRQDRLEFSYSLDATSLASGTWAGVSALDFLSPTTAGTVGALDGNAESNRQLIAHHLTGLSVASGSSLWLRWVDIDAAGADDGLAIDDFSIQAVRTGGVQGVPESMSVLPLGIILGLLCGAGPAIGKRERRRLVACR
jgi:hypothetical protein